MLRNLGLLVIVSFLLGCQSTQDNVVAENPHYLDLSFNGYQDIEIESEDDVFELDDDAKRFVSRYLSNHDTPGEVMNTLVRKIFDRTDFNMLYSGAANTVASETFANKTANCLSLSIMTYALAKEAGLGVAFQEIQIPEYWTRRDGFSILNGHVNLKLYSRNESGKLFLGGRSLVIDFDPFSPKKRFPSHVVSKQRILAMFYNNKGAEALIHNRHNEAYAYFRAAIETEPLFQSAWINLAILYRFTEHYHWAERTYQQALKLDGKNLTILENLAILYEVQGRPDLAKEMMETVQRKREKNPYYQYILGEQELENGEFDLALSYFKRAIAIDRSKHEFYFGMARTYAAMGQLEQSEIYLRKAKRNSDLLDQKSKYQNKIDLITRL